MWHDPSRFSPATQGDLIGRAAELAQLTISGHQAAAGDTTLVIVHGEAGVGKSRLVAHFADNVTSAGVIVLWGTCSELSRDGLAHAPLVSVLRQIWDRWSVDQLAELMPGSTLLTQVIPESAEPVGQPDIVAAQLFSLFGELLKRLSLDLPLLLVIEDAHWADQSTLDLIQTLAREMRHARVETVVTYRSDEHVSNHSTRHFLAELERVTGVTSISLNPFSRRETEELTVQLHGSRLPPAVVDEIFELSGGNAFFVEELMHRYDQAASTESGYSSLDDVLMRGVRRLSEQTRQVVYTAAVGGRMVSHHLLATVSELPNDVMAATIREAVQGHILVVDRNQYKFRHALVREAILANSLPAETIPLHRRYAEALRKQPQLVGPDQVDATVAHHWWSADEPAQALPALLRAANTARTTRAPAESLRLLLRALETWPRVTDPADRTGVTRATVLEWAASAARDTARFSEAINLIDEALAEVDHEKDPSRAATLLASRSTLMLNLNWGLGINETLARARQAERLVPHGVSRARGVTLSILSEALLYSGDAANALAMSNEALDIAQKLRKNRLAVSARTVRALAHARLGNPRLGLAELQEARATADRRDDLASMTWVDIRICLLLYSTETHPDEIIVAARRGLEVAARAGLARSRGMWFATYLAGALFDAGRWDESLSTVHDALALGPDPLHAALPHLSGALTTVAQGDADTARAHLAAVRSGLKYGQQDHLLVAHVEAQIALNEKRIHDARREVGRVLQDARTYLDTRAAWILVNTAAQVEKEAHIMSRSHRVDLTSRNNVAMIRKIATELPTDTLVWRAHAAQLDAELDSFDTPSRLWPDVVHAWDTARVAYNSCYARIRAAEAVAAQRNRSEMKRLLRAAAQQADHLGAAWLRRDARQLASHAHISLAGERNEPGIHTRTEALHLTPREAEVLGLLAQGMTNRQIGTELFMATKTVSVHVSRILTKLGVATRSQAAATVHRLRLFDDPNNH